MRRLTLSSGVLALSIAAALTAQSTSPIYYPQAGIDGSSGNLVPLGFSNSSPNFDEGRAQVIVPARFLPTTGGAILGLDVLSQATIAVTYTSLNITFSAVPAGSTLSSSFASNLPAPVQVFSGTTYTINWARQQWQTIPLNQPYIYDGVSDLVVDFQKVYDRATYPPQTLAHHQTTSNPGRSDLSTMRYAFGVFGSGASVAANAAVSASTLKVGFQFAGLPTTYLTGWRGGASNNVFAVGQQFDSSLQGTPGSIHGSLISFGWLLRGFPVPGVAGFVLIDPATAVAYSSGPIGPTGVETLRWTIPNDPNLVGATMTFQGLSQDLGGSLVVTNATDCIIRS